MFSFYSIWSNSEWRIIIWNSDHADELAPDGDVLHAPRGAASALVRAQTTRRSNRGPIRAPQRHVHRPPQPQLGLQLRRILPGYTDILVLVYARIQSIYLSVVNSDMLITPTCLADDEIGHHTVHRAVGDSVSEENIQVVYRELIKFSWSCIFTVVFGPNPNLATSSKIAPGRNLFSYHRN